MVVGWETEGGGDEQRDSDEEWSIETSSGWVWQHPASTGDRGKLLIFFFDSWQNMTNCWEDQIQNQYFHICTDYNWSDQRRWLFVNFVSKSRTC